MNIYYDENMPFATEFFQEFGTLHAFKGRELNAEQLVDADVLLVRSITQVNEALLANSPELKFVGTATIGVDHIDQALLASRAIEFTSAPGCNAVSVAEYVISSLVVLAERYQTNLFDLTVGIVGAGNTGSRLSEKLTALGIKHKLCDPFLAADSNDRRSFVELDEIIDCDVISLHVPKTMDGLHPTYHLFDEKRLGKLNEQQILINACRGEVIDNNALLAMKKCGHGLKLILDVWESEPNIVTELIDYCEITTAHIAGYSLEGKSRGTEMLYQALCHLLAKPVNKRLSGLLPKPNISEVTIKQNFEQVLLNQLVKMVYDVRRDDSIFRQQIYRYGFDHIRKNYPTRREFSAIDLAITPQVQAEQLFELGFNKL